MTAQAANALLLANARRRDMRDLSLSITALGCRAGASKVAELLTDPTEDALAMPVGRLLRSIDRFGEVSAGQALRAAGVVSGDRRVRDLTDRQRASLAAELQRRARLYRCRHEVVPPDLLSVAEVLSRGEGPMLAFDVAALLGVPSRGAGQRLVALERRGLVSHITVRRRARWRSDVVSAWSLTSAGRRLVERVMAGESPSPVEPAAPLVNPEATFCPRCQVDAVGNGLGECVWCDAPLIVREVAA